MVIVLVLLLLLTAKPAMYTDLVTPYSFQQFAIETLGLISDTVHEFLFYLGHKISLQSRLHSDSVVQCNFTT